MSNGLSWQEEEELLKLLEDEALHDRKTNLVRWVIDTHANYVPGWVHRDLCEKLEEFSRAVAAGESPRLIVSFPPRHGKSAIASVRFPTWHLGKHPDHFIVNASYNQGMANKFSKQARALARLSIMRETFPDLELDEDSQSVENWETTQGGGYKAVGVGGGLTGHGAHILCIDDPVKDREQAESETYREMVWDWYTNVAYTRLMPGAGVLIIMTRWHEDDLVGRLLTAMKKGEGDKWTVVEYPAIAEVDEEHRKAGEALHEARYPLKTLLGIKETIGAYAWSALYQQRPTPEGGGRVQIRWFQRYSKPPEEVLMIVQSWDTASKAKELNDFWVCGTWAITKNGFYLLHVFRKRMEYPEGKKMAYTLANEWKPNMILVEDKGTGTTLIQDFREDTNWAVKDILPITDKIVRMVVNTPPIETGKVWLPEMAGWLPDFEHEVSMFENGTNDDQVDMMSQFLDWAVRNAIHQPLLMADTTSYRQIVSPQIPTLPAVSHTSNSFLTPSMSLARRTGSRDNIDLYKQLLLKKGD